MRVSRQAEITQEAPREVDRQDNTQREQTHYSHEKDDVALKCQVRDCINATLTTDLFVPARSEEKPIPSQMYIVDECEKVS